MNRNQLVFYGKPSAGTHSPERCIF